VDRDDRVLGVELTREHRPDLAGLDVLRQSLEDPGEILGDLLALARPFDQDAGVVDLLPQRLRELLVLLDPAAPLQRLLRVRLVLPEVGLGDPRFELAEVLRQARFVKAPSGDRGRARSVRCAA
jgi:hypothetical protein